MKVAIENCPMWFDETNWPGGQNLFTTPAIWRKCFEIIPSPSFGINYDPSHFVWQQMDYIRPCTSSRTGSSTSTTRTSSSTPRSWPTWA